MSIPRCIAATLACALVAAAGARVEASPTRPRFLVKRAAAGISHVRDVGDRVRQRLEAHGFVVGTPPTWIVTPSVTKIEVVEKTTVACRIEIRVAPLDARGREVWEASRMMIASGSAQLSNSRALRPHEIARWSAD